MGQIYDSISTALDSAYKLPHIAGDKLDKTDLKLAAEVIVNGVEDVTNKRIIIASLVSDIQSLDISNKVAYCNETAMLYGYISDINSYVQYGGTVIQSDVTGGWVEHDAYNKFMQPSSVISLDHTNQSSTITLTGSTDFTAKSDLYINNGHTHVCKLFCNGYTPTFSGFEFLVNSSPLELDTIDITSGYYHTVVFFKMVNVNKFIILEKVLSSDVTPPTITVSLTSKTDTSIIYTVNSNENSELKWALYLGGSSGKTTNDIDNGVGALQYGAKSLSTGNNTLTITSLSGLTTYDLWQYAYDAIPNKSIPAKTTVQTNESGVSQLVAPILGIVTVLSTTSLSVPIASSSIDANTSSVSLYYKRATDPTYTPIVNIGKTDVSYTLSALDVNTQYYIYLVAVGDGISYSDSVPSNIATPTTQNIAPTLSVPYTSTDGLIIELPFSRAMANPSVQTELFTPSGGKSVVSVALKSGDATKIQVTVNSAYTNTDTITISVASGLVPADAGVVFGGVTNQNVTNNILLIKSMVFDNNINNFISATPTASVTFGNGTTTDAPQSYSAWAKLLSISAISPIFSRGDNTFGMATYVNTNGSVTVAFYDDSHTVLIYGTTAAGVVVANSWNHFATVYGGTATNVGFDLYINGVMRTLTRSGTGSYTAMPNLNTKLRVGSFKQGAINLYKSNALISDYSISNIKLSASNVSELFNLGTAHPSTLSFANNVMLYTRLNGSLVNEVGDAVFSITGSLSYSIEGAY